MATSIEKPMKKAKSDQPDPAKEDALRLAQKIRMLPKPVQNAFESLVDLAAVKSKKAGGKDD